MAGPKAVTQYEAVREKIGAGLSVGEAIKAVAEDLGIKPGTVHTNYYRMAREHGTVAKRRVRVTSRMTRTDTPSESLVRTAMEALNELAKRNEELEADSARLQQLRKAMTDTP